MKVLYRDPEEGSVFLNPRELPALVANSRRRRASAVICGHDIAVSTIPCTSHADTADWAGFEGDWLHEENIRDTLSTGILSLMAEKDLITVEVWSDSDGPECPFEEADLKALYDRVRTHRRLRRMIDGGYGLEVAVHIFSGPERAWSFDDAGLACHLERQPGLSPA